jgi:hypothetical protein
MVRARVFVFLAAAGLGATLRASALAQQRVAPSSFVPAADYANPDNWLCRPGRADACKVDQSATEVSASGRLRLEEFDPPKREPLIDCFYVYPTVSNDPGELSDLIPGPEERNVVSQQFARFAASCRQFAPMYRQVTLGALRTSMAAQPGGGGASSGPVFRETAPGGGYNDVLAAWNYYLTHDNKGRGFVLIGHSQGTSHLIKLIQEQIDGKPIQRQLVSAILLGGAVQVPVGKDTGATFKTIPLCRADRQTGCVINYSSFRDTVPPPANSLFARNGDGVVAACTNPADLKSGKGEPVSYFAAARPNDPVTGAPVGWVTPFQPIGTPFVTTPGLVTTTCVNAGGFSYLAVHVNAKPRDPRSDTIDGDVMTAGKDINAAWGLHLIDINLSMGDLVDLVGKEGRAWKPAK